MDNFLRKDTKHWWNDKCQHSLDILKENMVATPILVFLYWEKELCVYVNAYAIELGEA
jgi:hypothetical protein